MADPEVNPSVATPEVHETAVPDANAILNGEFYVNDRDGKTHIRVPAGGSGGGVTSYADVVATPEQHVAFLQSQVDAKQAEVDAMKEKHAGADKELQEKKAKEAKDKPDAPLTSHSAVASPFQPTPLPQPTPAAPAHP
jgi:hypothetical protein